MPKTDTPEQEKLDRDCDIEGLCRALISFASSNPPIGIFRCSACCGRIVDDVCADCGASRAHDHEEALNDMFENANDRATRGRGAMFDLRLRADFWPSTFVENAVCEARLPKAARLMCLHPGVSRILEDAGSRADALVESILEWEQRARTPEGEDLADVSAYRDAKHKVKTLRAKRHAHKTKTRSKKATSRKKSQSKKALKELLDLRDAERYLKGALARPKIAFGWSDRLHGDYSDLRAEAFNLEEVLDDILSVIRDCEAGESPEAHDDAEQAGPSPLLSSKGVKQILTYIRKKGHIPTYDTATTDLRIGRGTYSKALRELREKGLIH